MVLLSPSYCGHGCSERWGTSMVVVQLAVNQRASKMPSSDSIRLLGQLTELRKTRLTSWISSLLYRTQSALPVHPDLHVRRTRAWLPPVCLPALGWMSAGDPTPQLLPASRRWDGCRPGTPTPQLLPAAHAASPGCSSDCLLSVIPAGPSTETARPCLPRGQRLQPRNQMQSDRSHTALEPAAAFLLSFHKGLQTPGGPEGREALRRCSPRGRKESDTTEQLNSNNVKDCKEAKGQQRQQRPLVGPEGCSAARPFPGTGVAPFPGTGVAPFPGTGVAPFPAPGWTPSRTPWGGPPSRDTGVAPFRAPRVDPLPRQSGWTPFPDTPGWTPPPAGGSRTLSLPWRHGWSLRPRTKEHGCA
ncbi:hypothetical protein R6Z07F_006282 [Ovis aries]